MVELGDVRFWLPVIVIVALGTVGGALFKYATNIHGEVTFQRVMELRISIRSLAYLALMAAGVLVILYSGHSLGDSSFAMAFLFSPVVFLALVLLFASRFLMGIPLSVSGLGRLTAILTTLTVVTTAIVSAAFFGEEFNTRVIAGLLLGILSILLIGQA
ncbi:MAG: hypothetical protein V1857_01560 [archaeon]